MIVMVEKAYDKQIPISMELDVELIDKMWYKNSFLKWTIRIAVRTIIRRRTTVNTVHTYMLLSRQ